jgi:hypothetical protein
MLVYTKNVEIILDLEIKLNFININHGIRRRCDLTPPSNVYMDEILQDWNKETSLESYTGHGRYVKAESYADC